MCGRPRESRTARPCEDHLLYESHDPQKTSGVACLAQVTNSAAPAPLPLARRDHGPGGPDGPDGRGRPLSTTSPGVSSLGGRVSALHWRRRDHLAAMVPRRRRDRRRPRRTSNRRSTRVTPGSAGLASKQRPRQPVVVAAARYSSPSYVEAARRRRGPLWLPPWFQASLSSASRRPLWAKPSARADRSGGNNCWRCSPVFSFCF